MLDTLMVLWKKGFYNRFVRLAVLAALLLAGIGLAVFIALISGGKWAGQASTNSARDASSVLATPTTDWSDLPIILQNPRVARKTSTTSISAPGISGITTNGGVTQNPNTRYHTQKSLPTKTPYHTAPKKHTPGPQPMPTSPIVVPAPAPDAGDPFTQLPKILTPLLSGALNQAGYSATHLAASIHGKNSPTSTGGLFWALLSIIFLVVLFCFGLLAAQRRQQREG